jgi:hypothetical protein
MHTPLGCAANAHSKKYLKDNDKLALAEETMKMKEWAAHKGPP